MEMNADDGTFDLGDLVTLKATGEVWEVSAVVYKGFDVKPTPPPEYSISLWLAPDTKIRVEEGMIELWEQESPLAGAEKVLAEMRKELKELKERKELEELKERKERKELEGETAPPEDSTTINFTNPGRPEMRTELKKHALGRASAQVLGFSDEYDPEHRWYDGFALLEFIIDNEEDPDPQHVTIWAPFEHDSWEMILQRIDDEAEALYNSYKTILNLAKKGIIESAIDGIPDLDPYEMNMEQLVEDGVNAAEMSANVESATVTVTVDKVERKLGAGEVL